MDKNIIVAIVLAALVLVAGIQALQLFSLKNKIATGQASVQSSGSSGSGVSVGLPSGLQDLPSMVGGC